MRHTRPRRLATITALLAAVLIGTGTASAANTGTPAPTAQEARQDMFHDLAGAWNVQQRMWAGPGAQPRELPAATATVQVAPDGAYLAEQMTQAGDTAPFARHALLGYNAITQNYEYVSTDSRAPQMMAYPTSQVDGAGGIWFTLPSPFVLPEWGEYRDAAFKGRLHVQPGRDHYTVRLYWTRLSSQPSEEFLAMEYDYTRK